MRKRFLSVLSAMSLLAVIAVAGNANALGATNLVYDTQSKKGAPFGGPADMNGPVVGKVTSSVTASALVLEVDIDYGQPRSTYTLFLNCGPTHATATCNGRLGTIAVNKLGQALVTFSVQFSSLRCTAFGTGARNDHLDLVGSDAAGSTLVAGPITYTIPTGPCSTTAAKTADSGSGDALTG
jgi:hypothetical protein